MAESQFCKVPSSEVAQTVEVEKQRLDGDSAQTSMRLVLRQNPDQRRVCWAKDTVDNENLNRKKSKCCCIYVKPTKFGESSSDDEEKAECEHCRGHVEKHRQSKKHADDKDPSGKVD